MHASMFLDDPNATPRPWVEPRPYTVKVKLADTNGQHAWLDVSAGTEMTVLHFDGGKAHAVAFAREVLAAAEALPDVADTPETNREDIAA